MKYVLLENIANRGDLNSFDIATMELLKKFDIDVAKIENSNFSNSRDTHLLDDGLTSLVIDAYNLALVEDTNANLICYDDFSFNSYTKTKNCLKDNKELKEKVNEKLSKLGKEYRGSVKITHLVDLISENIGIDNLKTRVKNSFSDFNIALYYGNGYCQTKEGANINKIEDILSAIGAKVIKLDTIYNGCGYEYLNTHTKISHQIAGEMLLDMFDNSADIVTSTETSAFIMFDKNQKALECEIGRDIKLPFLNLAQLILLATGEVDSKNIGLEYHKIEPKFI